MKTWYEISMNKSFLIMEIEISRKKAVLINEKTASTG